MEGSTYDMSVLRAGVKNTSGTNAQQTRKRIQGSRKRAKSARVPMCRRKSAQAATGDQGNVATKAKNQMAPSGLWRAAPYKSPVQPGSTKRLKCSPTMK